MASSPQTPEVEKKPSTMRELWSYFPKFNLDNSRFDQNTYVGRMLHFANLTDPRRLLVSSTTLEANKKLIEDFRNGKLANINNKQLWIAKENIDAAIHPDTKQKIWAPFTWSAFMPMNVPILVGMIFFSNTYAATMFWQWINQTYNVCLNFANRNASNQQSTTQILGAYICAASSAMIISGYLKSLVTKIKFRSPVRQAIGEMMVPFTAVACAGFANVSIMRYNEATQGIEIQDQFGQTYGKSKVAGSLAVLECGATRMFMPIFYLIMAPGLIRILDAMNMYPKARLPRELANILIISASLQLAVPPGIALFPFRASVPYTMVEKQYQNCTDQNGKHVDVFYFNKGT